MGNEKQEKNLVISGVAWKFGERIIAQGVSFVISLVLARALMPEQYGTVSLVLVFINIANVFVSDGLGASLIQKKDADDIDFSTMFYCSICLAALLYILLFLLAPYIAEFYDNYSLISIIRVLALQIPLASVKTIQHSYVSKNMMFKKFFWSTLGGTIISGIIGIVMAYRGYGVWALVAQYLVNSAIDMIVLFVTVKWRPKLVFSKKSAGKMFSYSWKLLASQLINTMYIECKGLIIAKVYTESDLAYTNKGEQFPRLLIYNLNTSISTVLFPAMAKVNDDDQKVKELTKKSMKLSAYIIFPLMIGMIVIAEPMVRLLLTEKWMSCIPFLRLWCLFWMVQPCQTANVQAIKAVGRSDVCLKLEIVKKIFGFGLVLGTMFISVKALIISNTVFGFISAIINIFPNRTLIKYGYKEQLKDMAPITCLSVFMGVGVYLLSYLRLPDVFLIILQIVVGGVVYIVGSRIFKFESYALIIDLLKKFILKNSKRKEI